MEDIMNRFFGANQVKVAGQLILADPSLVWFAAMSTNTVISTKNCAFLPAAASCLCPKSPKYGEGAIVSEKVIIAVGYPLIQYGARMLSGLAASS